MKINRIEEPAFPDYFPKMRKQNRQKKRKKDKKFKDIFEKEIGKKLGLR